MRKADHTDACWKEQQEPSRRFFAIDPPGEPRERQRCEQCAKRAGQSCGGFAYAEKFEACGGHPIIKDRLFEPRLPVKARRDPIAALRHVARDPRVTRLIGTHETDRAEIAEVADRERDYDQRGPANSRGYALARFFVR